MKKNIFAFVLMFGASSIYGQELGVEKNDSNIIIMTYNIQKQSYKENGKVIYESGADVVAVQEITFGFFNFAALKKYAEMEGKGAAAIATTAVGYGIALLWKPHLGVPIITIKKIHRRNGSSDADIQRAYIIAEFNDFCFISTHFSLDAKDRETMINSILESNVVQNCKKSGKPVYVAGDLNVTPDNPVIDLFKSDNFEMLNKLDKIPNTEKYVEATRADGKMIDLILEQNANASHQTLESRVPDCADRTFTISDHLPYIVKVRIK